MSLLKKEDIAQMNRNYFQSLEPEVLVEVACNLHELAVDQMERLEQNSKNSSRPPSSDSPYPIPFGTYFAKQTDVQILFKKVGYL